MYSSKFAGVKGPTTGISPEILKCLIHNTCCSSNDEELIENEVMIFAPQRLRLVAESPDRLVLITVSCQ